MLLEVRLNTGMLGLSIGMLIAGLYGMNLVNGVEGGIVGVPYYTRSLYWRKTNTVN